MVALYSELKDTYNSIKSNTDYSKQLTYLKKLFDYACLKPGFLYDATEFFHDEKAKIKWSLIHRDLKPENFLGGGVLIDFELARYGPRVDDLAFVVLTHCIDEDKFFPERFAALVSGYCYDNPELLSVYELRYLVNTTIPVFASLEPARQAKLNMVGMPFGTKFFEPQQLYLKQWLVSFQDCLNKCNIVTSADFCALIKNHMQNIPLPQTLDSPDSKANNQTTFLSAFNSIEQITSDIWQKLSSKDVKFRS
jgi:serine/threonine protein kinase